MAAIADFGRRIVPANRGHMIEAARRVQAEAIDVVTLAVLAERAQGASWSEVADALSLNVQFVIDHYRPIEERWKTGLGVGPVLHSLDCPRLVHGN